LYSSTLQFTSSTTTDGVFERDFTLGDVPGVLWTSNQRPHGAPLILMGHGGGLHKRSPGLVARARRAVANDGFSAATIDSPGHGDRPRSDDDQRWVDAMLHARDAGEPLAGIVSEFNAALAERAVPEWRAVIDALQLLPEIGADTPIGYSGMTLASEILIRLASADDRIAAAIFGGVFASSGLLEAARSVTIPVEILLPWDDAELDRESGLALFDAFGSQDKTLHVFPGSHFRVPEERVDTRFFARQLLRRSSPAQPSQHS
jgi:alpha-beta hydrolase superfamily lysophospholipase